jgi:hypothetical protein
MSIFLDFDFLVILNVLVALLWLAGSPYTADRRSVIGVIVLIMAVIAVMADIFFLVLHFSH